MTKLAKSQLAAVIVIGALLFGPMEAAMADSGRHRVDVFATVLTGSQEISPTGVPGAGDPDGIGVFVAVAIHSDPATICYVLTAHKVTTPVASHIHMAPAGSNGPIVVNLTPPTNGFSADCISEGEIVNGVPAFPGTTVDAITANPAGFYANVHTADFPMGAIRGQVAGR